MISDRTVHTLELDKILQRLADHASFSAGRDAALALRPATESRAARERLSQTTEARMLLQAKPSTHLGGAHDVRSAVRRAEVGSVLTAAELLQIADTLGAAARFRNAVRGDELNLRWLRVQAEQMAEDRDLQSMLNDTFSDRGEILDSASPALRRIRHDTHAAQGRLMDRLNGMIASQDYRSALQEPIVTMRNGRYVIPVRSESRGKVPGVIHDQSSSGQTVFVEPLVVTDMNNRVKELELEEQREIERILQALSARVATLAPQLRGTVEALRDVDLAFAKAKYAVSLRATEPALNDEGRVSLVTARHPLLSGDVVPVSIWLGVDFRVLVITGPNTGGKTVSLKTVGLLTLMAQCGMHVPAAAESEMAVFPEIYADIGDEQSIEQSLSTFSSHMRNIVAMIPHFGDRSLVLLDELGAGTDPAEGAALARSILTTLVESGARAVVTTHYSELKTFAHESEGVENASVEFDVETLSPTYRLTIGVPGRSQAIAIAKRLGMPQRVLALARQSVSAGAVRVEKLLSQIQSERQEIGNMYRRAAELHDDARKLRDRVQNELRTVRRDREEILQAAREESSGIVRDLRARLREIESSVQGGTSRREQRETRAKLDEVLESTSSALGQAKGPAEAEGAMAVVKPGSTVNVLSLGQQGSVLSVAGGEAEVQVGLFKVRVPTDDLEILSKKAREPERSVRFESTREAPPMEMDVRGWRTDDALREVDQYLHDNYMHGQGTIRIIHGKGTGALRSAIREQLSGHPLVKSAETERRELGGDGVTVVKLNV
jgi:DNA mismatch repair protein MutS2